MLKTDKENNKIKILFFNGNKSAGVNYYRTLTPATELENVAGDIFHIEIWNKIDYKDPELLNKLKVFDVIHYHKQLHPDVNIMMDISTKLKENGTVLIMDVDDYWHLDKDHALFELHIKQKYSLKTVFNLKTADYITTTSDYFAQTIKTLTGKDNVFVFENSVNPKWMKQFENNNKPDPDGLVRIIYMAGSTHRKDVELLRGVVNMLQADKETKNKFKVLIAGWNAKGKKKEAVFNQDLGNDLQSLGLWDEKMIADINRSKGNIMVVDRIPNNIKEQYKGKIFILEETVIDSKESPYWFYEEILTDNHRLIQQDDYKRWLLTFEENGVYDNEHNFGRRWTENVNKYAKVLDEADIVLAPLQTTKFNQHKSNLKMVEAWTRKLPVVCSDTVPYNLDGVDNENCVLVENKKNSAKHWKKRLKELILNPEKRRVIGEGLYNTFKDKYNLENVTKRRSEFYQKVVNEKNI